MALTESPELAPGANPRPPASPESHSTPLSERLTGFLTNQQTILLLVLIGMVVVFSILNPIFFSLDVFGNVLLDWGPVALIAVAETFVIISGGIDLSVGATLGFSGVIAAYAMQAMTAAGMGDSITILCGTLVAAATGMFVGFVNSLLINRLHLVPFIATLATLGAAGGMSIVLTGGAPVGDGPQSAIDLSVPWLGPLSWPLIVVIVVVIIAGLFLHKARFGRYTYAIGSNPFAALAAGINVKRHLTKIYVLSGLLSGLAGMFLYIRLGSGAPTSGVGDELDAIAAVVIGGVALAGGIGRMSGTVLGSLILATVTSGLIIIGVEPNWKQVVVAILIAAAVSLQALRANGKRS
ncbi:MULTISPECIES: ABC transporter permease [Subtercola]|uniref:ABC transporter permease n=1 Tax=Subtercola vilae TaxID=2056433 RepID=A0A4T2BV98_9MICO|nr:MULTISPECIES: ABC transporter permease [Subtercola]MEA9984669.1 ABC transporter permease [Subtercola sp. RTI3]TIH35290.1 ABC transporter permease [Subtercola vilae]